MPIAYVFSCLQKKRNEEKESKRKTHDVFHQKPYSKMNVTKKGVALSDNIIVSLFTMGCCKVLSSLKIWEFFFNHEKQLP